LYISLKPVRKPVLNYIGGKKMASSRLHITERGKREGRKVPLVLLHGYPFEGSAWEHQLSGLGDEMWVVAPDMPGFGKSAALLPPTTAHVDQYAKALADWAKGEGITQLVLAGHSMGGYVAFAFARKYPEMLHSLILVATRPGADNEAGKEGRYRTAGAVEERGAIAAVEAMLPKLFAPEAYEEKKELVESVRAMMMRQSEEGILAALYAMASRPDSTHDLAEIEVPTLIITGAQDAIIPAAEGPGMQAHIKGAHAVAIPKTGHMPMLEDPEAFNKALREFLGRSS
jgi:pimeloyl-ACP methyl ester carboxylesterase